MKYFIAQIIGFIAFFFSIIAYHKNKKEKILKCMIISNLLNIVHYFLLDAFSGLFTKIIAIIRDFFIIFKSKNNKFNNNIFLFIFIIIYFLIAFVNYKNIWSLFPIIAAIIYLIPIWYGNKKTVKIAALCSYFFWLFYNIFVLSISGIIFNIISIISTSIAVYNEIINKNH